jgi:hypothetical protein
MSEYMAAKMDDQITGAVSENERLRAELAAYQAAIEELVACKDLHDRMEGGPKVDGHHPDLGEWKAIKEEYCRRKPLAWAAARALVEE